MAIPVPGRLADGIRQSVVQIRGKGGRMGTGVVVMPGNVITNAHVVYGSEIDVEDWEGATLRASTIKMSLSRDLALLSVVGLKAGTISLGDSKHLRPGTPVFAIGNPLGFVGAVSSGVIHSLKLDRWICADVRLAPGNSGGPLTNFSGQVVGINTMVTRGGLALAVPSRAVEQFLKHDESQNLGVMVKGVEFRGRFGVLVTGIVPDSPAERASLLLGDILTGANGVTFSHLDDLTDALDGAANGLVQLEFYRGDGQAARHVTCTVGRLAARSAA